MRKKLYKELGRMLLLSVGIYAALFVVLLVVERLCEP